MTRILMIGAMLAAMLAGAVPAYAGHGSHGGFASGNSGFHFGQTNPLAHNGG